MHDDASELGSLILIGIIPKERSYNVYLYNQNIYIKHVQSH